MLRWSLIFSLMVASVLLGYYCFVRFGKDYVSLIMVYIFYHYVFAERALVFDLIGSFLNLLYDKFFNKFCGMTIVVLE